MILTVCFKHCAHNNNIMYCTVYMHVNANLQKSMHESDLN